MNFIFPRKFLIIFFVISSILSLGLNLIPIANAQWDDPVYVPPPEYSEAEKSNIRDSQEQARYEKEKIKLEREAREAEQEAWETEQLEKKRLEYYALIEKGRDLLYQEKYQEAIIWFDKAIAFDPKRETAFADKGAALLYQEKYQEAIIWFDKALALEPDDDDAVYGKKLALDNIVFETQRQEDSKEDTFEKTEFETKREESNGGGCLIATAAYGTELAPQVQFLREIRDNTVMSTASGTAFMTGFNQLYYSFSPTIADLERENPIFREAVKVVITPLLTSLSIMTIAEDGNGIQVLGFGLSVIVLNLGLYIVAPAALGFKVHRQLKSRKQSINLGTMYKF